MKKKIVIAIVLVLLLPVIAYLVLFGYGTYLIESVKMQQRAVDRKMESLKENDNGFGESGLKVVDSGYFTRLHDWLDNDHVIFVKQLKVGEDKNLDVNFVWNIHDNVIKPIQFNGWFYCFRNGNFYFRSSSVDYLRKKIIRLSLKSIERISQKLIVIGVYRILSILKIFGRMMIKIFSTT